jgi:hypothetical protein
VDMRIVEPIWHTDESGAEASLVERLEAQVEALTSKVARLERRQHRFADMIRLQLELHDRLAARLKALDGRDTCESLDELSLAAEELTETTTTVPLPRRPRRAVARRDA